MTLLAGTVAMEPVPLPGDADNSSQVARGLFVRVKNTFIDDWDNSSDEGLGTQHVMGRRAFRTCPDLLGPAEPESELSPDLPPAVPAPDLGPPVEATAAVAGTAPTTSAIGSEPGLAPQGGLALLLRLMERPARMAGSAAAVSAPPPPRPPLLAGTSVGPLQAPTNPPADVDLLGTLHHLLQGDSAAPDAAALQAGGLTEPTTSGAGLPLSAFDCGGQLDNTDGTSTWGAWLLDEDLPSPPATHAVSFAEHRQRLRGTGHMSSQASRRSAEAIGVPEAVVKGPATSVASFPAPVASGSGGGRPAGQSAVAQRRWPCSCESGVAVPAPVVPQAVVASRAATQDQAKELLPHAACPGGVKVARSRRGGRATSKLWCHLYLSEDMLRPGFELNKKIIGHSGSCTKGIFDATGAKVRLRGRGSKHLEGGREAPVHLMLAVTTEKGELESFREAFRMAIELLRDVERRFLSFCRQRQLPAPQEPCFWVGEITAEGRACLGTAADGLFLPAAPPMKKGFKAQ
eukprot:CAMPEP_0179156204 /NCGR_PEP_ID=MMETSP0796-20121207/76141_1 /TAXON_ID=73915 /ORGANISM="Pyrodinium bahamense, Strain pbaha01" /LENGTH=515 /DNA_ID=CAMNT_0020857771 /DNA_START=10 /DNA_END=1557 /DNA_ORIENTATION=+